MNEHRAFGLACGCYRIGEPDPLLVGDIHLGPVLQDVNSTPVMRILIRVLSLSMIIKLHPSDQDFAFYRDAVKQAGGGDVEITATTMDECGLEHGDIAVVGNSSSGMDAVILGARVITVDLPSLPNPIPYSKLGVGERASLDTVRQAVEQIMAWSDDELASRRELFLEQYCLALDGRASDRAAAVIDCVIATGAASSPD